MQFISTAVLAALAFAAPSFQSTPSAHVINNCAFDVNLWSVAAGDPGRKITLPAKTGTYNETYRVPTVGGVSLKLTPEDNCVNPTPVTQFEYTLAGGFIWYDISDIDCFGAECPFKKYGMYMHSGQGCPTVSCPKGILCAGAYNQPDDNWATRACAQTSDIYLYLCSEQKPTVKPTSTPLAKRVSRHFRHAHSHSV